MDGIGIFDIANIYSPVGESTGRSQGRKDPLAAELHRTPWAASAPSRSASYRNAKGGPRG